MQEPAVAKDYAEKSAIIWTAPYPPQGQGIFTFNVLRRTSFSLVVRAINGNKKVSLEIGHDIAQFKLWDEEMWLLAEACAEGVGYTPDRVTSYWFSLNRDTMVLKYGKGCFMEETTLLVYDFLMGLSIEEQTRRRCNMQTIFGPQYSKSIEFHGISTEDSHGMHMKCLTSSTEGVNSMDMTKELLVSSLERDVVDSTRTLHATDLNSKVEFYPCPLTVNWPFAVKESSKASLFELDSNEYIFTGSLPPECQELYSNIASATVNLDWVPSPRMYKLSDAIRYSFDTEGKALNTKLRQKKMKYIRVTVGPHRSPSPGIPYVLELWPKNHGSPVHSHGNSYGVIKVLHGGLRAEVYNKDMETKIKHFNIRKGDVTWMSPYWYQCHRLFNDTSDFCATLQCYRYGVTDARMWPYFDYVNEDGSPGCFLPNSDFTFTELYHIVLEEYSEYMEII